MARKRYGEDDIYRDIGRYHGPNLTDGGQMADSYSYTGRSSSS